MEFNPFEQGYPMLIIKQPKFIEDKEISKLCCVTYAQQSGKTLTEFKNFLRVISPDLRKYQELFILNSLSSYMPQIRNIEMILESKLEGSVKRTKPVKFSDITYPDDYLRKRIKYAKTPLNHQRYERMLGDNSKKKRGK